MSPVASIAEKKRKAEEVLAAADSDGDGQNGRVQKKHKDEVEEEKGGGIEHEVKYENEMIKVKVEDEKEIANEAEDENKEIKVEAEGKKEEVEVTVHMAENTPNLEVVDKLRALIRGNEPFFSKKLLSLIEGGDEQIINALISKIPQLTTDVAVC